MDFQLIYKFIISSLNEAGLSGNNKQLNGLPIQLPGGIDHNVSLLRNDKLLPDLDGSNLGIRQNINQSGVIQKGSYKDIRRS